MVTNGTAGGLCDDCAIAEKHTIKIHASIPEALRIRNNHSTGHTSEARCSPERLQLAQTCEPIAVGNVNDFILSRRLVFNCTTVNRHRYSFCSSPIGLLQNEYRCPRIRQAEHKQTVLSSCPPRTLLRSRRRAFGRRRWPWHWLDPFFQIIGGSRRDSGRSPQLRLRV